MTATPPTQDRLDRTALGAALTCFTIWGFLPLLFQACGRAGAGTGELTAWRIMASLPVVGAMVLATGQGGAALAVLRQPKLLWALFATSLLIGVNWVVYVWAVQHGQTLSASFGYYINPLINVCVGAWLFKERLSRMAAVAIAIAAAGVGVEAWALGGVPWVALTLAGVFGAYGVIRKQAPVGAQTGLLVETLILALPAGIYLYGQETYGAGGAFGRDTAATLLLLASGVATAIPLVAFSVAAKRLPLSVIGFIQFLQPTILFGVGAATGEPVDAPRLAAFGFIWLGVAVFVVDMARRASRQRLAA